MINAERHCGRRADYLYSNIFAIPGFEPPTFPARGPNSTQLDYETTSVEIIFILFYKIGAAVIGQFVRGSTKQRVPHFRSDSP